MDFSILIMVLAVVAVAVACEASVELAIAVLARRGHAGAEPDGARPPGR